jgi:hypothetical protein
VNPDVNISCFSFFPQKVSNMVKMLKLYFFLVDLPRNLTLLLLVVRPSTRSPQPQRWNVQSSGVPQGSRRLSPPVGCFLATLLFAAALNVGIFVINILPFDLPRHRSINVIWTALAYHACVRPACCGQCVAWQALPVQLG